jgi:hypothetical protein
MGRRLQPKNSGYDRFPLAVNGWEPYTPYQETTPPLQDEEGGHQPKKN